MLGKQMVTDSGRGEAVEMTAVPLDVGLERETRVELATPAALEGSTLLGK